jgi:hypothetical protein
MTVLPHHTGKIQLRLRPYPSLYPSRAPSRDRVSLAAWCGEPIKRRDHGEETLAEIGHSYNLSGWTIARLMI